MVAISLKRHQKRGQVTRAVPARKPRSLLHMAAGLGVAGGAGGLM